MTLASAEARTYSRSGASIVTREWKKPSSTWAGEAGQFDLSLEDAIPPRASRRPSGQCRVARPANEVAVVPIDTRRTRRADQHAFLGAARRVTLSTARVAGITDEVDGIESSSALTASEKSAHDDFVVKRRGDLPIVADLIQESSVNRDSVLQRGRGAGLAKHETCSLRGRRTEQRSLVCRRQRLSACALRVAVVTTLSEPS